MKRKKIIRYSLLGLLLLLASAAFYIYKEYNRTHKDTARLKPDYRLNAAEFINEFRQNEQASNKKYWDKVVSIKGMVKELNRDERGFYTIVLGDTSSMSSVRCSIDSVHGRDAAGIKKQTVITVKGICSGYNADEMLGSDVILVRSVVEIENKLN
jgi:DNA polymerase II small subunit/DNA polymerase delta subunit B